jgi:hypothetical protein
MIASLLAFLGPPSLAASALEPGSYAMLLHQSALAEIPVLGSLRSATRSYLLVQVEQGQEAGSWWHVQRACFVETSGGPGTVKVSFSPAFVAALPQRRVPISLYTEGTEVIYAVDLGVDHLGYDPARSGRWPPERPDDPSLSDPDRDGHPGLTVAVTAPLLGEGSIYVAQHAHLQLRGAVGPDGLPGGGVSSVTVAQTVLGASHRLLMVSPRVTPDAEGSWWQMVQLPPGAGCEAVRPALMGVAGRK